MKCNKPPSCLKGFFQEALYTNRPLTVVHLFFMGFKSTAITCLLGVSAALELVHLHHLASIYKVRIYNQ